MDCEATRAALSAAEGAGVPPDAEGHLVSCGACRAWALDLERLSGRLGEWTAPEPAEDFDARAIALVRRQRRPARRFVAAAQAAVFLLGALAGYAGVQLVRRGPPPQETAAVDPPLDVTDEYVAVFSKERHP